MQIMLQTLLLVLLENTGVIETLCSPIAWPDIRQESLKLATLMK